MEAFRLTAEQTRVIVPDTGGGIRRQAYWRSRHRGRAIGQGGRQAGLAAMDASGREFAWAYFRPAAAFEARAGLRGEKIVAWDFTAYNPGTAGIETPYAVPNVRTQYFPCDSPLREGSYRGIGATGNNFAREVLMDELAEAAGLDPLEFRLANSNDERLSNVLQAAADRFGWPPGQSSGQYCGSGIAAGFEKGSYIAICAQVRVEGESVEVERLVSAFECGAILNPRNLQAQVEGLRHSGPGRGAE